MEYQMAFKFYEILSTMNIYKFNNFFCKLVFLSKKVQQGSEFQIANILSQKISISFSTDVIMVFNLPE
jgi:hypothetical protein